jgi:beta-galactosidase
VPDVQFCYCPHTRARFRGWLRDRYVTLEALNAAWYRGFEAWEEVDPPRFGTILSYTDFIDWKLFLYDKLAADLGMRAAAVRRADPGHVVTSHAAIPSVFSSPYNGYGPTDDFLMAGKVDYYGTSLYPKHNHPDRHWEPWMLMVAVDFSASANRRNGGFFVGELQAGPGTYGLNVGDPITPRDHRRWMWSAIAKGARAINVYAYYPMSSGYESGGYGLVRLDGTPTERAVEAGRTARLVADNAALLLASQPSPAQVALVYNPLAQMVGGEQRHGPGSMLQESLFGYYRMFAEHNVPVDFIHLRDLEAASLDGYRLIVVPYPLMLSSRAALGIESFVKGGGFVVAEARLAWNDERGFASAAIPGMGLHRVFGATEAAIRMRERVTMTTTGADHPLLEGLPAGSPLSGAYFEETLTPLSVGGAVVLAETEKGVPGVVAARHGAGEAALIGSFVGMADHGNPSEVNRRFALNMLDWAGVAPPLRSSHGFPVELRLRESGCTRLLFCINHGQSAEDVRVDLPVDVEATYSVRSLIDGRALDATMTGPNLRLRVRVPAEDVEALVVEPARP